MGTGLHAENSLPRVLQGLLYPSALLGVALVAWAQIVLRADTGYLFDFYPLYRGAEALLRYGDAYAIPILDEPALGVIAVGNAYPIHAVLLGMPFVWLPPATAVVTWTLAVGVAWILAVRWAGESPYWFLWVPMWQALLIQQPSAALGVAAIVALGALRRNAPWALSVALVLLTIKPQQFLVLVLFLGWCGRAWWRQMAFTSSVVALGTFLIQPDWIWRWMERIDVRADLVPVIWVWPILIPVGVLLYVRGHRESGAAIASSALGPWPAVGGYYMATAFPLGADRTRAATFALLGLLGLLVLLGYVAGESLGFVIVVGAGLLLASLLEAHRDRDR